MEQNERRKAERREEESREFLRYIIQSMTETAAIDSRIGTEFMNHASANLSHTSVSPDYFMQRYSAYSVNQPDTE